MTGASSVPGGISTANFNNLLALAGLAGQKAFKLKVFSFLEKDEDRPSFLPQETPFKAFRGQKLNYLFRLLASVFITRPALFIFDHVRLALPLLPLAALGLVKTVIFAHGSESWKRMKPTSRWSFESAELCLTNSQFTLKKMKNKISRLKGETCPLGLSPEFPLNPTIPNHALKPSIELEGADGERRRLKEKFLLLVARMDEREGNKGHRILLEIFPELLREFKEVQLVFPGEGTDRPRLIQFAQEKGVASSVFFPGRLPLRDLCDLYQNCYAYVMPSQQEGFGLVYLEAMNYGKACVGCRDQGAEDIIVHGETGFLIQDPENSEELLGVLRLLLKDPGLTQRLGEKGFERLHQYFTAQHHQERVKAQIAKLLGK